MVNYYSYIVSRDYGFAPNPFGYYCTLATCKPRIRKSANVNDWIFGISPKVRAEGNDLIFAMKVCSKLTYTEYWNHFEFQYKKPVMNGSLKQMYGDNIYYFENDSWYQANSHHSYENGEINMNNLNRDVKGEFVLISDDFFYFGGNPIEIPFNLKKEFSIGIGHRKVCESSALQVVRWLELNKEKGYNSDPYLFKKFERYNGQ